MSAHGGGGVLGVGGGTKWKRLIKKKRFTSNFICFESKSQMLEHLNYLCK